MFDFGFGELLLIAVVALVVLGPERLPKVARLAGLWARKARTQWNAVKAELESELADEELRRSLRETSDAWRESAEALRGGVQQLQQLPDAVRNDPDVVDSMAVMSPLTAEQRAVQNAAFAQTVATPAVVDRPKTRARTRAIPKAAVLADATASDELAMPLEIDPAQMSLLDPDPQMSLPLFVVTQHPSAQNLAVDDSNRPRTDA